ncbi:MAG: hypothetical protein ABIV06_12600, partial [Thermoanaerobaculia bacterium]
MQPRIGSSFRCALIAAVVALSSATTAAPAVTVEARLVAPPGSETELKSTLSLEVKALPSGLLQPVAKGSMLVQMEVTRLQKELDGQ